MHENSVDIWQGLAETKAGFGNVEVRQAAVLLVLVSSLFYLHCLPMEVSFMLLFITKLFDFI